MKIWKIKKLLVHLHCYQSEAFPMLLFAFSTKINVLHQLPHFFRLLEYNSLKFIPQTSYSTNLLSLYTTMCMNRMALCISLCRVLISTSEKIEY
jgi:tellurite resistance protein TehA-like permease